MKHETWMDERQGQAYTHGNAPLTDTFRNEYHSSQASLSKPDPLTQADRDQIIKWQLEAEIRNQCLLENQSAMAE